MSSKAKLSVTGWEMNGGAYRNGHRYPGFTLLHFSDGTSRHYPERVSLDEALNREAEDYGTDTVDARLKLDHWVRTGEGATFRLSR